MTPYPADSHCFVCLFTDMTYIMVWSYRQADLAGVQRVTWAWAVLSLLTALTLPPILQSHCYRLPFGVSAGHSRGLSWGLCRLCAASVDPPEAYYSLGKVFNHYFRFSAWARPQLFTKATPVLSGNVWIGHWQFCVEDIQIPPWEAWSVICCVSLESYGWRVLQDTLPVFSLSSRRI